MTSLYPFQEKVIADVDAAIAAGRRRIILVAPTGGGKTVIASALIKCVAQERQSSLVFAHRREIIEQTSANYSVTELRTASFSRQAKLARSNTSRSLPSKRFGSAHAVHCARAAATGRLLVVDEAHHCPADTTRSSTAIRDAILIGLTATPCRGDGRGLGGIFETLIEWPQVAELIAHGYLVRTRVTRRSIPICGACAPWPATMTRASSPTRMDRPKLIGDIVTHWHKYGERRKTVAFAVNVRHSIHLRDELLKAGVRAEHIDGGDAKA